MRNAGPAAAATGGRENLSAGFLDEDDDAGGAIPGYSNFGSRSASVEVPAVFVSVSAWSLTFVTSTVACADVFDMLGGGTGKRC